MVIFVVWVIVIGRGHKKDLWDIDTLVLDVDTGFGVVYFLNIY